MRLGPPEPLQSLATLGAGAAGATGPVNTVAPVVSGLNQIGETLTTTTGTWTGAPTITYTYQWARFTLGDAFIEDITGETGSTYLLDAADLDLKIGCYLTGTNGAGSDEALSNLTNQVTYPPLPPASFPAAFDGTLVARYKADEIPLSDGDNIIEVADLSTNGNDLATIGGSPTWHTPVVNGHAVMRGDGVSDYIKGTFGSSVTGGNYVIGVVRKWNSAYAAQQVLVDGAGQFQAAYYRTASNVGNAFFNGSNQLIGATTGPTDQWAYVECRVTGASSTVKVNGSIVASGSLTTTTLAGLTLFADGSTAQKSDGDIAEVFVVNTPSAGDLTALEEYALAEYGLAPPAGATANIVCAGDSNTAGTLTFAESYPAQLQTLLNSSYPDAYVVNTGVGGWTWLNLIANEAAYTALVQPGIPNVLVVQCGLNDYAAGTSIATIISRMETFLGDMAPIFDDIIMLTAMPAVLAGADFVGTDFEALADGYMAATVDTNVTLVDQRTAAPTIGADGAQLTSTFQADNKHLSASGNLVEAETVETAVIVSLAPPATPTGFTATAAESEIALSWDAQPEADTFDILFSLEDNIVTASSLATGVTGTSFTHDSGESIQVGEKYYYWIKATNGAGDSDYTASVTARSFVTLVNGVPRNLTTPAGTWTLETILFGNTAPVPVGINITIGSTDYSSAGDGTWENNDTGLPDNPSISGAFITSKTFGTGTFTFWDAEP